MQRMKLTEEEKEIIKENYNKVTIRQLSLLIPRWINFRTRLKDHVKRLGYSRNRNTVKLPISAFYDLHYWKYPNLINTYLAGNVAADACILNRSNRGYLFTVCVSRHDECLVDTYIKELKFKGKKQFISKTYPKTGKIFEFVRLSLSCFQDNAKYLKEHYNLEPRKTKRLRPINLDNKYLIWAYIQGMIDGDGCIRIEKKKYKDTEYIGVSLSYCSCSKDVVYWMKDLYDSNFSIKDKRLPKVCHKKNAYVYTINGLRAAIVINYLRKLPLQNQRLARKWDNPEVLAFIEEKKKERPELFIEPNQEELALLMPKNTKPSQIAEAAQIHQATEVAQIATPSLIAATASATSSELIAA